MSLLKNYYNPDDTNIGLECYWQIINGKLFIEISETNSFVDWLLHFLGAFIPKKYNGILFHRFWLIQADELYCFLKNMVFNDFEIRGWSHGGATGIDLDYFFWLNPESQFGKIKTAAAPCPALNVCLGHKNYRSEHLRNKGDIIPFLPPWFKRNKNIITDKKWQPVWKSHQNYDWRFKKEDLYPE